MKALRLVAGKLKLDEVPVPVREGEALVRVLLAGICGTDLQITRGYAAFEGTLGHEFVGLVEASPDASQVGCRVVGEINAGCGACALCRAGDPRHCARRTVLGIRGRDGAFAEYLTLPPQNLRPVPDAIEDQQAVFAEPLAAAAAILDRVEITSSLRVLIIGDGRLGQLIARVLAATGCELTLLGRHDEKLRLAASAGIRAFRREGIIGDESERWDLVVEASGAPGGLDAALDLVRPRGTIILKSSFRGEAVIESARLVVDEISLVGSRCGRLDRALELLEAGGLDLGPLITDRYPLEAGVAAMDRAGAHDALKVLLRP